MNRYDIISVIVDNCSGNDAVPEALSAVGPTTRSLVERTSVGFHAGRVSIRCSHDPLVGCEQRSVDWTRLDSVPNELLPWLLRYPVTPVHLLVTGSVLTAS